MRICFVTPFYYPNITGGGEISVKLLAEKLTEEGHKVTVLTFDKSRCLQKEINGVNIVRYRTLSQKALFLTSIPYVVRAMRKWENMVDLYHVYNVAPMAAAGLYKKFGGKKRVIATLNSFTAFCPIGSAIYGCKSCNLAKRLRCLLNPSIDEQRSVIEQIASIPYSIVYPLLTEMSVRLDQYIAPTAAVKVLYSRFGFDEKKIAVIPNFIDFDPEKNICSRSGSKDTINILFVGALQTAKGVGILVKAFSRVARRHENAYLFLVGTGPRIHDYTRSLERLGIEKKVIFTGYLDNEEKCTYYLKADIFVHPAIWPEPSARTLLEAMSFRIPLVVSNAGGSPEVVEDAGLVFESGNVEDLQRKIELIIDNKEIAEKLSSKCAEVLKKHTCKYVMDKIVELYKVILTGTSA